MKHRILGALALVMLFVAGAAHAGTTLSVLIDNNPKSVNGLNALIEAYTAKNPGIAFQTEIRPGGAEGDNIMKTRLATGEMTDIFTYNSGAMMRGLNPDRMMADLTDLACMGPIDASYKKVQTVNGKIVSVPMGTVAAGGIFYNKRVYRELGLEVPHTWADFIANCQKIKDSGAAAPIAQTYSVDTWSSQLLVLADFYNVQLAEPDFAEKYTANQLKFADVPAAVAGFEHLKECFEKGFYNEDFNAAAYPDGLRMLAEGEAAHYPMLSYAIGAWNADYREELMNDIGFFGVPGTDPEKHGITLWMPDAIYASASSPNLEEAKKFIDFAGSVDGVKLFLSVNSAEGPPFIAGIELPEGTPPAVYDMLPYFEKGNVAPALEFMSPIKGPILEQLTVEVGSGMRDPKEAAALYDNDVEKQAKQLNMPGW